MQLRPDDYLSRVPALPKSRKDDALAPSLYFPAFPRIQMTQERLGEIISICRQAVNEIENRRVYPHYTTIAQFAALEKRHEEARRVTASLRKPCWS